jgi:hypothetical protein
MASTTDSEDTPMTATYIKVVVVEAIILIALWVFGRLFS